MVSKQAEYTTLGEVMFFVAILFAGLIVVSFTAFVDTYDLQRRVGQLEQQVKQLESR